MKLTYTENELAEVLHCSKRSVSEMRKKHVIKGTKIGRRYIYFYKEIETLFDDFRGKAIRRS